MSVWLCAGLWMLVHLSVYRHYLDVCMHVHSCVCVCACVCVCVCVCERRPTSDLFRNKRTWRPRGADLLSPPPLTFSLSLSFFFLSIFKY